MRLLKNKRAIELSVNFIVMVILAIAVFSLGILFANKLFANTNEMREEIDRQTDAEIEALIEDGSKVAIARNKMTIERGERHNFGLGIMNPNADNRFGVMITGYKEAGGGPLEFGEDNPLQTWGTVNENSEIKIWDGTVNTNENAKVMIPIIVNTQAAKGQTYIVDVIVCTWIDSSKKDDRIQTCTNSNPSNPSYRSYGESEKYKIYVTVA